MRLKLKIERYRQSKKKINWTCTHIFSFMYEAHLIWTFFINKTKLFIFEQLFDKENKFSFLQSKEGFC